jgi:hypothetical protein
LQRLAAIFGEDILVEMLETVGEKYEEKRIQVTLNIHAEWFEESRRGDDPGAAYAELEMAVQEMKLPKMLEFYLWAYPPYRAFIESSLDLNSRIPGPGGNVGTAIVEEAVAQAQNWIKALPIPPAIGQQAERAAQIPWLRFRTEALKRIGRRPLGPVY